MTASAFAPAKVNLYLHVGPLAADGFHPLQTLMVFADVGDEVSLASEPWPSLQVTGPFAGELGEGDNLVSRASDLLAARVGGARGGAGLRLDKRLPVAAGLGGGSADAAATLRLLNLAWKADLDALALEALAAELGSDVPACIRSLPVTASGRGEILRPAPRLPVLHAVLVNPGLACPTGPVYRAFDLTATEGPPEPVPDPGELTDTRAVAGWLSLLRNDLEGPAVAVAPEIAGVLERLRGASEVLLARLSGSGATCFALCASAGAASQLAAGLSREQPGWWIRACRLGAPLSRQT